MRPWRIGPARTGIYFSGTAWQALIEVCSDFAAGAFGVRCDAAESESESASAPARGLALAERRFRVGIAPGLLEAGCAWLPETTVGSLPGAGTGAAPAFSAGAGLVNGDLFAFAED